MATLFGVCSLMLVGRVNGGFEDLVKLTPDGANVVVLIDVEQLLNTSLAQKEGWREKHEAQFEAGMVIAPPQTKQLVMSAQLDVQFMHPVWQMSLLDLQYEPNLAKAAAMFNGNVDTIGGLNAAILPSDTFVVQFGPKLIGIGSPANRQNVGRWVGQTKTNTSGDLSPYLAEAVKFAERGSPIIMALDLQHVYSADYIREKLAASEVLTQMKVDLDDLSQMLASIRGVTLGITVKEKRFGKIKVDFASDLKISNELAKMMLLHVLKNHGIMVSEFEGWTAKVTAHQISIEGNLEASGMRRILSILDAPPSLHIAPQSTASDSIDYQKDLLAQTSKKYFKSVVSLVDDLRNKDPGGGNTTTGAIAKWYGRYAKKIDNLPVLNVDPELVSFGSVISEMLRGAETSMRDIGPNSRLAADSVGVGYDTYTRSNVYGVGYGGVYGSYGWASVPDYSSQRINQINASNAQRIRGYSSANLIMQHVDEAMGDMRKKMTVKLGTEF